MKHIDFFHKYFKEAEQAKKKMKSPRGMSFYQEDKKINNNYNENSQGGEELNNMEISPQNISQDTDTLMKVSI